MRRQPRSPTGIAAREMERQEAAQQSPALDVARSASVIRLQLCFMRCARPARLALNSRSRMTTFASRLSARRQRVEVARTDRGPLVVGHRDLAVQRPARSIRRCARPPSAGGGTACSRRLHDRHVGLALQDQAHVDAAARGAAHVLDAAGSRGRNRRWRSRCACAPRGSRRGSGARCRRGARRCRARRTSPRRCRPRHVAAARAQLRRQRHHERRRWCAGLRRARRSGSGGSPRRAGPRISTA